MDLVYGVCLKYLRTPDDAKDAVINIYEELIIKVKKHQVEHFKAWLYQLAKNHCLMILRKKKTFPIEIDSELVQLKDESHLEEAMTKEAHLTIMQECINQLVSQQKIAIELFYFKEKCYKEIAETTKMDVNKVKSFIQNGRRNLKICMDNKIQKSFN
jgi:RNA polymerase sigma-70 factor (ECF subfamily)